MLSIGSSARLAAAAVACAIVAPAFADAPAMTLTINSGMFGKNLQLDPSSIVNCVGTYAGSTFGMNDLWRLDYNLAASVNGSMGSQSGSLSLTNLSGATQTYSITLSLPTLVTGDYTGLFNGSLAAVLITGGPGSMSSVEGLPLWTASSGGVVAGELFTDPFSATRNGPGATSLGSRSFGGTAPSVPSDTYGEMLSITLNFVLSANATASFSSAFAGVGTPVPAPGALAVLGLAGLSSRRRRR
jgi:MYXO-CTERM domain-containing protein